MAFDLWTHPFCLSCDRQTEGAAYCSESCRLADFDKSPCNTSTACSPVSTAASGWAAHQSSRLALSPAIDFSKKCSGSPTDSASSFLDSWMGAQLPSKRPVLSPSSSHTSLSSFHSASSAKSTSNDSLLISDKSKKELESYARLFETARNNRRRSY